MANSITPPPELVQQWLSSHDFLWGPLEQGSITITPNRLQSVATRAAQWGADQELEACCDWLKDPCAADMPSLAKDLQHSRRFKPPSLKEQALEVFEALIHGDARGLDVGVIRRALKALPND
jgi:hypothetical protein